MLEDEKLLHYVTKDPIQNLRIRVTLTRISVQRPRPLLHVPAEEPGRLGLPGYLPQPLIYDPAAPQQPQQWQNQSSPDEQQQQPNQQQQQDTQKDEGNSQQTNPQHRSTAQPPDGQQRRSNNAGLADPFATLSISTRTRGGGRPVGEANEGVSRWNLGSSPTNQGQPQQYQQGGQGAGGVAFVPNAQRQLQFPPAAAQQQQQFDPAQSQQWPPPPQQYDPQQQYIPEGQQQQQQQQQQYSAQQQPQQYVPQAQYTIPQQFTNSQQPQNQQSYNPQGQQQQSGNPQAGVQASDYQPLQQQEGQQLPPDFHQGVDPGAVQYGAGIQGPVPYGQVPTQALDADAVMRALLEPQQYGGAAAGPGAPGQLPERFTVTQVFAWQEKVYSTAEIAAAQIAAQASPPSFASPPSMGPGSPGAQSRRNVGFGSQSNLTAAKLLMLNFRSMYIMADLGDHADSSNTNERMLVCLKAQPDGSLYMRPGFSKPGFTYKFEDVHGGIYEYTVENASTTTAPSLDKRTAKLEKAVLQRADELRRAALKVDFQKPPGDPDALRLILLAEIVSAADFECDHLYIEYVVRFDPQLWQLETSWPQAEPGVLQGVTHISAVTLYPEDLARDQAARHVAHFCHPIELEWISRPEGAGELAGPIPHNRFPTVFFQVCHMDRWSRYTSEGYGWATLGTNCPSASTQYIKTWKPLGTVRDAHQAFFVGGSLELEDLDYLTTPTGFEGKLLSKYGFKTQTAGTIKVRFHTITQQFNPDIKDGPRSPSPPRHASSGAVSDDKHAAALSKQNRRHVNVVYRARARLEEARGGEMKLRPGLVSEAPVIRVHPEGARVGEGGVVKMKVLAMGVEPLRYQWSKDDKKLTTATADSQELILVDVNSGDSGAYYCKVSNKDGSANSNSADLLVQRVPRAVRGAGGSEEARAAPRGPATPVSPKSQRMRPSRLQRAEMSAAAAGSATHTAASSSSLANPDMDPLLTPSGSQPMPPDIRANDISASQQQPIAQHPPASQATDAGQTFGLDQVPQQQQHDSTAEPPTARDSSTSHLVIPTASTDGFRRKTKSGSRAALTVGIP